MIKKLCWKFVIVIMFIVTLIFLGLFSSVLIATKKNLEAESIAVLYRAISESHTFKKPGEDMRDMSLPYFTISVDANGTMYIVNSNFYALDDAESISEIVNLGLASEKSLGVLNKYNLRYYKEFSGTNWQIAFVDLSTEKIIIANLVQTSLLIGGASLFVFFFISILLARWVVKPVEKTWNQQRRFVADASHELKTPLTVILSNIDMIASHQKEGDTQGRKWSENIKAEAVQMRKLVEELLTLARSDDMKEKIILSKTNLSYLVDESILLFEPIIYESEKQLEQDVTEDLFVLGDAARIKQLLAILLDNALKYSSPQSTISISLTATNNKKALFAVKNFGETIPEEQLAKIFDRFYRMDAARQSNDSYGLGLAIAQEITNEHKGKIWAESNSGVISLFVSIPLAK